MKRSKTDMFGNAFRRGDVVIHASKGYGYVQQKIGIVTDVEGNFVKYAAISSRLSSRAYRTIIRAPYRSVIIGNVIDGTQPKMPASLMEAVEEVTRGA